MSELIQCSSCSAEVRTDLGYVRCPQCNNLLAGGTETSTQLRPNKKRKRKEYKVMSQKDRWFAGKFDPEALEGAINSYASQGWSVVSMATASIGSLGGNRDELIILFERER